jgi:hypothetical protein
MLDAACFVADAAVLAASLTAETAAPVVAAAAPATFAPMVDDGFTLPASSEARCPMLTMWNEPRMDAARATAVSPTLAVTRFPIP